MEAGRCFYHFTVLSRCYCGAVKSLISVSEIIAPVWLIADSG